MFSSLRADILPTASSSSYTHFSVRSRWEVGDIHDYCKFMIVQFEQRWGSGQPFWSCRLLKAVDNICVFLKQRGDYLILCKGLLSIFSQKAKCYTKISGTENLVSQETVVDEMATNHRELANIISHPMVSRSFVKSESHFLETSSFSF